MEVANCPKCGRVFTRVKDFLCPECTKKEEDTYNLVRDYIKENPKSTINQIVKDTGVSTKKINKYLRDGRLEVTSGISDFLKCMSCGASITTGKFCRNCSGKLAKNLEGAAVYKETEGPRMHHFKNSVEIKKENLK